ncbi:MAG TPA: hypothetical protein VK140_10085 [Ktedonobacteraceae bacterium]|nr:hypothetical protein [Ktedonobacteraceae bacterium]
MRVPWGRRGERDSIICVIRQQSLIVQAPGRGQAIAPTMDELGRLMHRRHSRGDGLSSPCCATLVVSFASSNSCACGAPASMEIAAFRA